MGRSWLLQKHSVESVKSRACAQAARSVLAEQQTFTHNTWKSRNEFLNSPKMTHNEIHKNIDSLTAPPLGSSTHLWWRSCGYDPPSFGRRSSPVHWCLYRRWRCHGSRSSSTLWSSSRTSCSCFPPRQSLRTSRGASSQGSPCPRPGTRSSAYSPESRRNDNKNDETKDEKNRIHIAFKRKDSKKLYFTRVKIMQERRESAAAGIEDKVPQDDGRAEAAKSDDIDTWRAEGEGKGSSSITSPQNRSEQPQKETTFIVLQKHEVTGREWTTGWTDQRTAPCRLGRNTNLRNMAPKQRSVGDTARTHHGRVRPIRQQTRGCDTVEQKMEESDQLGALWERTYCCNVDLGQQIPDCADERVHATQWLCWSSCREGLQNDYQDNWRRKRHEDFRRRLQRRTWPKWRIGVVCRWPLHVQKETRETSDVYHTSKEVQKQLDYFLSDRKHYKRSRDAEASDTIHMGSDHRCTGRHQWQFPVGLRWGWKSLNRLAARDLWR